MLDDKILVATTLTKQNSSLSSFNVNNQIIGKGRFSVVYKGEAIRNGEQVALKKVQLLNMSDATARVDCMKEIKLLQQLNHPNIIRYITSFVENKELYIVLELANGGDLSKMINVFISNCKLMSEKTIWKYFNQISSGLEYMHLKSIMHRDIKPANVFISSNDVMKLGDLGLGRYFSSNTKACGTIVGTPYYMSPERIQEKPYTFSSDIWSLGCLLYEMAALQPPFHTKKNLYVLIRKIENCDYCPVPSNIYSGKLRDLIKSCLTLNPEARPNIMRVQEFAIKRCV